MKGRILLISVYNLEAIGLKQVFFQMKDFDVSLIFFGECDGFKTNFPAEKDYKLLMSKLEELEPKIIGFSALSSNFNICKEIIKRLTKPYFIIIGGSHSIMMPEQCLEVADAVCVFEAEESITELCRKYFNKEDYTKVNNFWFRKNGKIIKNRIEPIKDLDKLQLPDFSNKNVYYILNKVLYEKKWRLSKYNQYPISAGRGCFFRCSFCIWSNLNKKNINFIRSRKVSNVIKEMKLVIKEFPDLKEFYISDDTFLKGDIEWTKEFCKEYKKINLPLWIQQHFKFINEEICILLKELNIKSINLGIQSANEEARKEIYDKNETNELIEMKVSLLKKHNLPTYYDIILANPFSLATDKYMDWVESPGIQYITSSATAIQSIQEFVRLGGGLLVFNSVGNNYNITELNELISPFNIHMKSQSSGLPSGFPREAFQSDITNHSLNFTENIESFPFWGNFIQTSGQLTHELAALQGNTTLASYQCPSGGRVLVFGSDLVFDNIGFSNYAYGGNMERNRLLAFNSVAWLAEGDFRNLENPPEFPTPLIFVLGVTIVGIAVITFIYRNTIREYL